MANKVQRKKNSDLLAPRKGASALQVFVVENSPFIRQGIIDFLGAQKDLSICGWADSFADALEALNNSHPNVALVDFSQGALDGFSEFKAKAGPVPTLAFSHLDENAFALRALRMGAAGFLSKNAPPTELAAALRVIASGRLFVSQALQQRILMDAVAARPLDPALAFASGNHSGGSVAPNGVSRLTPREREVLEAIGNGLPNRLIAAQMSLSGKTVETYRENIKAKLNLQNARKLADFARDYLAAASNLRSDNPTSKP